MKFEKLSITLPADLIVALRREVEAGAAASVSEVIRTTLRQRYAVQPPALVEPEPYGISDEQMDAILGG